MEKKRIEVAAAIICDGNKMFATQRGYGEWKDWWEFPGGKIEAGENPQDALKREIKEELATEIEVGDLITTVNYEYPKFHLKMHCFLCKMKNGNLTLLEHEAAKWLNLETLDTIKWLPADEIVVEVLKNRNQ